MAENFKQADSLYKLFTIIIKFQEIWYEKFVNLVKIKLLKKIYLSDLNE